MVMPDPSMKIGEVARRSSLSLDTLRFYERAGLLGHIQRSSGGMRLYDRDVLRRLAFIQRATRLGFSLAEIKAFLELGTASRASSETIESESRALLAIVDARIEDLHSLRETLHEQVRHTVEVSGRGRTSRRDAKRSRRSSRSRRNGR